MYNYIPFKISKVISLLSNFCQNFIGLWQGGTKQETVIYAEQQQQQTATEAEQMLLSVVSGKPRRRKMSFLAGIDTRICQKSNQNLSWVSEYLIFRMESSKRNLITEQLYDLLFAHINPFSFVVHLRDGRWWKRHCSKIRCFENPPLSPLPILGN